MRRRFLPLVTAIALLAMLIPPPHTAAAAPLGLSGLKDGDTVKGTIRFQVQVDATIARLYVYSLRSPWLDGTSYSWGDWSVPQAGTIDVSFDTALVGDGTHIVTAYGVDKEGRFRGVRSFSIKVDNSGTSTAPATHFEISSPAHQAAVEGVVDIGTVNQTFGAVASRVYTVARLGEKTFTETRLPGPAWDTAGWAPGYYALTVWGCGPAGELIDRSTVTVSYGVAQTPETQQVLIWETPVSGSTLKGSVTFAVTRSQDMATVKYYKSTDNVTFTEITASPWDTTKEADGTWYLEVRGFGSDSKQKASATIRVVVDNVTAPGAPDYALSFVDPPAGAFLHGVTTIRIMKGKDVFRVVLTLVDGGTSTLLAAASGTGSDVYARWDTAATAAGAYLLRVAGFDVDGTEVATQDVAVNIVQ